MSVDMIARGMAAAAAKGGGGGGTSVQSDWTQNDETAADYIKNRPGAYDIVQKTQVATGTFVDLSNVGDLISFPAAVAVEGQQVVVTVDGADAIYTVPAPDGDGVVYFGTNPAEEFAGDNPPENGYIFAVYATDDGEVDAASGQALATGSYVGKAWTLSLMDSTTVRIASKYLDLDAVAAAAAAAQTAAEEAKTAADRVPASTAADKDKFLRVDASGNPVWQTVPNANGGSF